jgi:hypothetical protein
MARIGERVVTAPGEIQPHEISPALITELSQLAQGDTPVKRIFLMYRKLVGLRSNRIGANFAKFDS